MHEASIALAIVEEIEERAVRDCFSKVTAVHLRVGMLSSVVPEALTFVWDAATEGTVASNSVLHIERVPMTIHCSSCDCDRTIPESMLPVCPVCDTPSNRIVAGRELLVTAMEVFYAAAPDRRPTEHPAQKRHVGT